MAEELAEEWRRFMVLVSWLMYLKENPYEGAERPQDMLLRVSFGIIVR